MVKQNKVPRLTGRKNNKKYNKNKKNAKVFTVGKIILLTFLSLLLIFVLGLYLFLKFYRPEINIEIEKPAMENLWGADELIPEDADIPPLYTIDSMTRKPDIYTFLILGLHDDGFLTDTIIFMSFDTVNKKIGIVNIPRDTYVNSLGYTGKKFNGVYKSGYNAALRAGKNKNEAVEDGIKAVVRMIKITFGVPVDKYILADLNGFKELVDAVGGVDMDVPVRMKYSDPEQNLYIDLQPGLQHLDGGKAEQLVRFRGYKLADIERINTQKKFMAALMKKMMKFDVGQIKKLFEINAKYVTTNLTAMDTGWFAAQIIDVKQPVKLENIIMHTIPGEEYRAGKESCYSTYKAEVMEIINKYYNPYTEDIPENNFNIFEPSRTYAHLADIDGVTMDSLIK